MSVLGEFKDSRPIKKLQQNLAIGSAIGELVYIGKPVKFSPKIDPLNRISDYIRNKMNIIDLIPCDYSIELMDKIVNGSVENMKAKDFLNDIVPKTTYQRSIKKYGDLVESYGLTRAAGVRIFTTDETVATDEFRNQFDNNIISSSLNSLSKFARNFRGISQSVSSEAPTAGGEAIKSFSAKTIDFTGNVVGLSEGMQKTAKQLVNIATDVLLTGKNISLPKVWDSSTYNPNTSVVIKLMSPYGSPKAVQQFIIRPLTYLMLLSLPRSTDGVSYGYPPLVTIKAYGMADISIGAISGITLRRGGNDTSFNIFKQPLTIDVSMEIINLVDGCASLDFTDVENNLFHDNAETIAYKNSSRHIADKNEYSPNQRSLLQTPGKIIQSLSPVGITNIVAENVGLTGDFINPPKGTPSDYIFTENTIRRTVPEEEVDTENSGIIMTQSEAYESQNSGAESANDMADREATPFEEELVLASMYNSSLA